MSDSFSSATAETFALAFDGEEQPTGPFKRELRTPPKGRRRRKHGTDAQISFPPWHHRNFRLDRCVLLSTFPFFPPAADREKRPSLFPLQDLGNGRGKTIKKVGRAVQLGGRRTVTSSEGFSDFRVCIVRLAGWLPGVPRRARWPDQGLPRERCVPNPERAFPLEGEEAGVGCGQMASRGPGVARVSVEFGFAFVSSAIFCDSCWCHLERPALFSGDATDRRANKWPAVEA